MVGIIGAMEIEVEQLCGLLSNLRVMERSSRTFYIGLLHDQEVVIVRAGIGKVNSAITTSILCENFDIDYVINIGVAGGYNVLEKSLVISSKAIYFDADARNFGYEMGQIPGEKQFFLADPELIKKATLASEELGFSFEVGTIATGDSFVTKVSQIEEVLEVAEDVLAIEMEGASIAQTASLYNKPFLIVRSISDVVGSTGQMGNYEEFSKLAADIAARLVERIIKK